MDNPKCKGLNFDECELTILRSSVDKIEETLGSKTATSDDVKKIIFIVEMFIRRKKLICYGGTAINNILPKQSQFYDKEVEVPDYDFFSNNALADTKELCDELHKAGYDEVEGKSGLHHGTFKVFVDFMAIADITQIPKELFQSLSAHTIRVGGLLYAPANFLRMGMYLELSRPNGDVSRWEKVLKRLALLNKAYPLIPTNCSKIHFQRRMKDETNMTNIYETVKSALIDRDVVFFGGYALAHYSEYMPKEFQHTIKQIPDFDVLIENANLVSEIVKERLEDSGIRNITITEHPPFGDLISNHYEVKVGKDVICVLYEPVACHSYNIVKEHGYDVRIATIDTIMSFYLAFIYLNRPYYNVDRLLCMSSYLFDVQQRNRLDQKGVLKRFSMSCIGHHLSMEEVRARKSAKYRELKDKRGTKQFEEYFLQYRPLDNKNQKTRNFFKKTKRNHPFRNRKTRRYKSNQFTLFNRR